MALEDLSLHDSNVREHSNEWQPTRYREKVTNLAELDLEKELLDNYNDAQDILTNLNPEVTPGNQQAQAMNTINGILKDIIKMRTDLYNSERIKKMESSIIYALKQFPELQEVFMSEYERLLQQ